MYVYTYTIESPLKERKQSTKNSGFWDNRDKFIYDINVYINLKENKMGIANSQKARGSEKKDEDDLRLHSSRADTQLKKKMYKFIIKMTISILLIFLQSHP